MKNKNFILLIILGIIGISNLVKVFSLDKHLKDAKESLKNAQEEIIDAKSTTTKAQKEIQNLQQKVEKYEIENEKLQLEIDSIILIKRAKAPKDWNERQDIKKKQKEISDRLTYLRQKDREFE